MESIEQSKALLVKDIENMKNGQLEEMILVSFYSLSSYFKSLIVFGGNSEITKDNINVIREIFQILKTERLLLNFILKNIDKFNIGAAQDVVNTIDELNDKTIEYYYSVMDDIEDAIDMKEERRGIRPKSNFRTLVQTDTYINQVFALAENRTNIKAFLKFEDEFWKYIEDKEHCVEVPFDIAEKISYVTALLDENGNVSGLKMLVPEVVDLNTALLAIRCYVRAHDVYKMIGGPLVSESICDYIGSQDLYQHKLATKGIALLKIKM